MPRHDNADFVRRSCPLRDSHTRRQSMEWGKIRWSRHRRREQMQRRRLHLQPGTQEKGTRRDKSLAAMPQIPTSPVWGGVLEKFPAPNRAPLARRPIFVDILHVALPICGELETWSATYKNFFNLGPNFEIVSMKRLKL